jgi:hypothetical protein
MNEYPPGSYIADAMSRLPAPGPDAPPQTVEIDARPNWGRYRVTFVARRNPQEELPHYWFWAMQSGKRL